MAKSKKGKVYLCIDLINPKTGNKETCYLCYGSIEAILKYTSHYASANDLYNNLPKVVKKEIAPLIERPLEFNIRRYKNSEPMEVIYNYDSDVLYNDSKIISNLVFDIFKNDTVMTVEQLKIARKIEELLLQPPAKKEIISKIEDVFDSYYDPDKNSKYLYMRNYTFPQKLLVLPYEARRAVQSITSNKIKKYELCKAIKEVYPIRLSTDMEYSKEKSRIVLSARADRLGYKGINVEIVENVGKFVGKELHLSSSEYKEYDDKEEKLEQNVTSATPDTRYYEQTKLDNFRNLRDAILNGASLEELSDEFDLVDIIDEVLHIGEVKYLDDSLQAFIENQKKID